VEADVAQPGQQRMSAACGPAVVDRFGRVRGNWLEFADLLRGRLTPERIEEL
jgi:hypothetical protein